MANKNKHRYRSRRSYKAHKEDCDFFFRWNSTYIYQMQKVLRKVGLF